MHVLLPRLVLLACLLPAAPALATVYYEYELAAQTGTASLVSIENEVSINERGQVAFIGDQNAAIGFESVYVGNPGSLAVSVNPGFSQSGRAFGPGAEINSATPSQVVTRDSFSGTTLFRLWDASAGTFSILDRSDTGPYDNLGFRPALNDVNQAAHGALQGALNLLVLPSATATVNNLFATRPAIANDGSVVARSGPMGNETDPIIYYDAAGTGMIVASTGDPPPMGNGTGWDALGRAPGISQDGSLVVWCGDRGNGLGIFAIEVSDLPVTDPADSMAKTIRIAGENATTTNPDLGYDASGMDIFLTFTAAQRDSRIGIAMQETAGPGLTAGNSFVVTFQGTPSAGSIDNPTLAPGTPLLFSDQVGVWAIRVDLETELDPPTPPGALVFNPNNATPVVQVGETLHTSMGSFSIASITELYDPIANVALDEMGMPRSQRRGDHQIAFRAVSGSDTIVIRAVQRDSDEDGLYDHWEEAGGGIDINGDGTIDLDLNALDADPFVRDIFIEIDWTQPRVDPVRGYSNQPADGALAMVATVYDLAPALPNGIPMGIEAHIDAGTGSDTLGDPFSQNFPTNRQGGNLIGQVGSPTMHLDLVYAGTPGSFSIPGGQVRSFEEIKRNFLGDPAELFARELAFHYMVLADSYAAFEDFATDVNMNGVYDSGDRIMPDGVLTLGEDTLFTDTINADHTTPRGATPSQLTVMSAGPASLGIRVPNGRPGVRST